MSTCTRCHDISFGCYGLIFFNDPATTEIYTLSLHDALPIFAGYTAPVRVVPAVAPLSVTAVVDPDGHLHVAYLEDHEPRDRKSTRLNSSHANISYAVFFL